MSKKETILLIKSIQNWIKEYEFKINDPTDQLWGHKNMVNKKAQELSVKLSQLEILFPDDHTIKRIANSELMTINDWLTNNQKDKELITGLLKSIDITQSYINIRQTIINSIEQTVSNNTHNFQLSEYIYKCLKS